MDPGLRGGDSGGLWHSAQAQRVWQLRVMGLSTHQCRRSPHPAAGQELGCPWCIPNVPRVQLRAEGERPCPEERAQQPHLHPSQSRSSSSSSPKSGAGGGRPFRLCKAQQGETAQPQQLLAFHNHHTDCSQIPASSEELEQGASLPKF